MKKAFKNYTIEIKERTFAIYLKGLKWFEFPISSSVDKEGMEDMDLKEINCKIHIDDNEIKAVYNTSSNLWENKIYTLTAKENGFYYSVKIKGDGKIKRIRYFSGGEGVFYEAAGYMLPKAEHRNKAESMYNIIQENEIDSWYFSPPPFVFPFYTEGEEDWFGLGLVAKKGQYNFEKFKYTYPFGFELPLLNRTVADGEYECQGIWGGAGKDAMNVIYNYSQWHYNEKFCERHSDYSLSPKWWKKPIFCGWGEQNNIAYRLKRDKGLEVPASECATQENYRKMMEKLKENGIEPGIIIIDAKWQQNMGTPVVDKNKWPDLRGFVDKMHSENKKVLLWIKSWDAEGLSKKECVSLLCNPIAADPTNPIYRKRIEENIKTLLSEDEGCFDCDGFKVDFINCIPKGEDIVTYEPGIYGVELMKRWLELVYTSAKKVKPDALMNVSSAHPYMASVCDQMRIHDYDGRMRSVCTTMAYRAEIVQSVFPEILIDCDAGGFGSKRDFLRYMEYQPKIGVPDLYWSASGPDVQLGEEEYKAIRTIWEKYSENIQ